MDWLPNCHSGKDKRCISLQQLKKLVTFTDCGVIEVSLNIETPNDTELKRARGPLPVVWIFQESQCEESLRFASGNNNGLISPQNPAADDSEKTSLWQELESPGGFRLRQSLWFQLNHTTTPRTPVF